MNRRDAITISKNEFKLTDEEVKQFDLNLSEFIEETRKNIPPDFQSGGIFEAVSAHIVGSKFFLTLIVFISGKESIDIETKEIEYEDYVNFLNKTKNETKNEN